MSLLYKKELPISDSLSIVIPSVEEVLDHEDEYYGCVSLILSDPYEMMVQLDDAGIDFTTLTSFELFCLLFGRIQERDTHLIFGGSSIQDFLPSVDPKTMDMVLRNTKTGFVIDKAVHAEICRAIRRINFLTYKARKPANDDAKKYMIERARVKQRRAMRKQRSNPQSQLEALIISLVNTEQFHYRYDDVQGLSIYQFNASLHQIIRKINYEHTMTGCLAGTIKAKELSQDEMQWLFTNK